MIILVIILLFSRLNVVSANILGATIKEHTGGKKLVRIVLPSLYSSFLSNSPFNWTFLAYFDGDSDLEDEAINALNRMELVGSDSHLNIVVQIDDYDIWGGQTRRYYVTYDNDLNNINSQLADNDTNEKDMTDPQTLTDFVCWAVDQYPAESYCLVIFDHGCGWRGVCWDDSNSNVSDCLTMGELKQSMGSIHDHLGKNLDILCFNACAMGMIEVFYQIKDYVDIGIASEDIQYDHLPYDLFLEDLRNNLSWTSEKFAKEIVKDSFYSYNHAVDDISAFYTVGVNDVAEKVDVLAEMLNETLQCCWYPIYRAIEKSLHFHDYFDLYDFASEINKRFFFSQKVKKSAQNVMNAIDNVLIETYSKTYGKNKSCHGLSIYLTYPPQLYSPKYEKLDFAHDTQWDEFLRTYLNKIKDSTVEVTTPQNSQTQDQNSRQGIQSTNYLIID